ncbi:MAG TPA: transposase [Kofleriaceae bacterium]|nr:transposase [Kofleriaceae bacterium]
MFTRGNNRRRLFSYPRERRAFLRLLARHLHARRCTLHAICLMNNHVHLMVTPPTVDALSRFMKDVLQRYGQIRNGKRAASGKLFEERFKSKPIVDPRQLAFAQMYIEANPNRAGLVGDVGQYPWSSYAIHAGAAADAKIPADLIVPSDWYCSLGPTPEVRQQRYRELFADYLARHDPTSDDSPIARAERAAMAPYTRRLRRPDGSSAAEPRASFVVSGEKMSDDEGIEG